MILYQQWINVQKPKKKTTFKFFNYKWDKVPTWANDTEYIQRQKYLERYEYNTLNNLSLYIMDKKRILEAGCGLARDSKMIAELNNKDDATISVSIKILCE